MFSWNFGDGASGHRNMRKFVASTLANLDKHFFFIVV